MQDQERIQVFLDNEFVAFKQSIEYEIRQLKFTESEKINALFVFINEYKKPVLNPELFIPIKKTKKEKIAKTDKTNQTAKTDKKEKTNQKTTIQNNSAVIIEDAIDDVNVIDVIEDMVNVDVVDDCFCTAKLPNGIKCQRKKTKTSNQYCGTHEKHFNKKNNEDVATTTIQKEQNNSAVIEVKIKEILGIPYYLDKDNNVYKHETIYSNNPEIIGLYEPSTNTILFHSSKIKIMN